MFQIPFWEDNGTTRQQPALLEKCLALPERIQGGCPVEVAPELPQKSNCISQEKNKGKETRYHNFLSNSYSVFFYLQQPSVKVSDSCLKIKKKKNQQHEPKYVSNCLKS